MNDESVSVYEIVATVHTGTYKFIRKSIEPNTKSLRGTFLTGEKLKRTRFTNKSPKQVQQQ